VRVTNTQPPDGEGEPPAPIDRDGAEAIGEGSLTFSRAEIRRRSLAGIFYVTTSNVANLVVGFFASLALARMLTPNDFGLVAVGSTVLLLAGVLADGGLGAGMIRRPEPPTRAELRTVNGIQLALTCAIVVPGIIVSLAFGRAGIVTAVMILSLPVAVLQTPGRIVLLRDMRYDRQLTVDLGSQIAYQVYCVASVALGAGVWGLATGALVRSAVATIVTGVVSIGFDLPSLRGWRKFGGLIRFGLSFQANWFAVVVREQSLNIVVAVVSGVGVLGIWTFANRLFQLPSLAFSSLYAVGFPAMANLLMRGEDPAPVILRTVRRAAIAGTFVFAPFAAMSPELIPSVFGNQWQDASTIMPFICLSTLVLGSISVAADSYLAAHGRPGVVAWSSLALGIGWLVVTTPLLPVIGATAIGVGNLAGAIVEAAILDIATRQSAGVAPSKPLVRPTAVAVVAGTAGWIVCTSGPPGLWIALVAGATTGVLCLVGLWAVCREDLTDTLQLSWETIGSALSSRESAPASEGASAEELKGFVG
jgi:O-antigen/teichoic acid export membrane protein